MVLVRRLKESFPKPVLDPASLQGPSLLWLLFMGGIAARGTVDRAWFVAHLVRLAPIVGLSGWDEVKCTLQKMLWIEKVLADRGKALWDELEIMSGVLSGQE